MFDLAISVLNSNGAEVQLSEVDELIAEEAIADGGDAFAFVPERIKLPAGGTLAFTTTSGDVIKPPLRAVVAVSQMARAYWPSLGTGQPPLCASPNGRQGWIGDVPMDQVKAAAGAQPRHPSFDTGQPGNRGPFDCSECPLAQFGSAANGRGQACKALRRLVVIPAGWRMPAILTLPPTSARLWDAYCSGLSNRNGAYFAVWTEFGLDKSRNQDGIEYATIKVSNAGAIGDVLQLRAVAEVRRQYQELVRSMPIEAAEYDTTVDAAA